MNSKSSETSDRHRLSLSLADKIDLWRKDIYLTLSNLSIYYTQKNIKKSYKNNKPKYQFQLGMKKLNYLMDHILYHIFNIILKAGGKEN